MKIETSTVDKPKFMGCLPDQPWWKTGSPESFLSCPNYFGLSLKDICFSVINTKFACFLFNHVPTYQELGCPLGDFGGHVGSPDRVMGRIWRLGDLLSVALRDWSHFAGFQPIISRRKLHDRCWEGSDWCRCPGVHAHLFWSNQGCCIGR